VVTFHILVEPVPYTFVSVNRRAHIAMCRPVFHYSVDLPIHMYTEPVPLKYEKTRHKISVDICGYF